MQEITIHYWNELPSDYTGLVYYLAAKIWIKEGYIHREDGPAIEGQGFNVHEKIWYLEGDPYTAENHFDKLFSESSIEKQEWMVFNIHIWRRKYN